MEPGISPRLIAGLPLEEQARMDSVYKRWCPAPQLVDERDRHIQRLTKELEAVLSLKISSGSQWNDVVLNSRQRLSLLHEEHRDNLRTIHNELESRQLAEKDPKMLEEDVESLQNEITMLQDAKMKTEESMRDLYRELELKQQFIDEYVKRGYRISQEKKELQERIKSLETELSATLHVQNQAQSQWKGIQTQEHALFQEQMHKVKTLLNQRTGELKVIRKAARVVLQQRTELEKFFLDSLEFVKTQIAKDRMADPSLPRRHQSPRASMEATQHASRIPTFPSEKVDISTLTWEDREKVLRLLFAKINSVSQRASTTEMRRVVEKS